VEICRIEIQSLWLRNITRRRRVFRYAFEYSLTVCEVIFSGMLQKPFWVYFLKSTYNYWGADMSLAPPGKKSGNTTFKLGHPCFDGGIRWCMFP
jgi:hypothetical protein